MRGPRKQRGAQTHECSTAGGAPEREFYRDALGAIPGHVLILDALQPGNPIVFANAAAEQDYGYTHSRLIGRAFFSLVAIESGAEQELEPLRHSIGSGEKLRTELRMVRLDGSKFTVGITLAPLVNPRGAFTHVVISGRDISSILEEERQRRELQERLYAEMRERERIAIELRMAQKLEAVGRLASGIAHEINTPIQFIGDGVAFLRDVFADLQLLLHGYAEAVQALVRGRSAAEVTAQLDAIADRINKPFIDAEVPGAFERTQEGIDRVASIVRAMREFAHPDVPEHAAADINRAIETTLLVARNEYKYCASVQTELAALPLVRCNLGELNQVFLNLIVNAAHAIEAAGHDASSGRIRITTAAKPDAVEIVFEDNGCGIPQENLERIFDPFFTTKEVGKGTGQGLSVARAIVVERHGGTISVDSTVNRGTRMTLRLPVAGGATL